MNILTPEEINETIKQADANAVSVECLKETVMFACTVSKWGNRAKCKDPRALEAYLALANAAGDVSRVNISQPEEGESAASKGAVKRVSATKVLVVSEPLDNLCDRLTAIKKKALAFAMPSFIRGGSFVVKKENISTLVETIDAEMAEVRGVYLPSFLNEYPTAIEVARRAPVTDGGLGPLWLEADYPDGAKLARKFGVRYSFFALTIPEGLPPEIRKEEERKLRAQYEEATQAMRDALRVMFAKLLDRAVERLTITPGQKPKVFRDSLIGNLNDFFETFNARDITSDRDLATLVSKCKEAIIGVTPDRVRTDLEFKATTARKLEAIKAAIDPMVEEIEERAFDFTTE